MKAYDLFNRYIIEMVTKRYARLAMRLDALLSRLKIFTSISDAYFNTSVGAGLWEFYKLWKAPKKDKTQPYTRVLYGLVFTGGGLFVILGTALTNLGMRYLSPVSIGITAIGCWKEFYIYYRAKSRAQELRALLDNLSQRSDPIFNNIRIREINDELKNNNDAAQKRSLTEELKNRAELYYCEERQKRAGVKAIYNALNVILGLALLAAFIAFPPMIIAVMVALCVVTLVDTIHIHKLTPVSDICRPDKSESTANILQRLTQESPQPHDTPAVVKRPVVLSPSAPPLSPPLVAPNPNGSPESPVYCSPTIRKP